MPARSFRGTAGVLIVGLALATALAPAATARRSSGGRSLRPFDYIALSEKPLVRPLTLTACFAQRQ